MTGIFPKSNCMAILNEFAVGKLRPCAQVIRLAPRVLATVISTNSKRDTARASLLLLVEMTGIEPVSKNRLI